MADDDPRKSWWHTLPGILTGITATITALGGLVVAINQTDWFSRSEPEPTPPVTGTPPEPDAKSTDPLLAQDPEAAPGSSAPDRPSGGATPPPPGAGSTPMVTLPTMRTYTMGEVEFTLLGATLAPRTSESSTLTIQVRLMNNQRSAVNFWDDQFRLLVDGIPRAPNSGLSVVVYGISAEEGDVRFVVPRSAIDTKLRILFADEKTDIPLGLVHGG